MKLPAFVVGLIALSAPLPVFADEIKIQVPVQLSGMMPNVKQIGVMCTVNNAAGKPLAWAYGQPWGVPDANGNLNISQQVVVSLPFGVKASEAKSYACSLNLSSGSGASGQNKVYFDGGGSPGVNSSAEASAKAGTPFVPVVKGVIP